MKISIIGTFLALLFLLTPLKVEPTNLIQSNSVVLEQTFVTIEEDGLVCDYVAKKARELIESLEVFSDETLDKIEEAVAAACDELL